MTEMFQNEQNTTNDSGKNTQTRFSLTSRFILQCFDADGWAAGRASHACKSSTTTIPKELTFGDQPKLE